MSRKSGASGLRSALEAARQSRTRVGTRRGQPISSCIVCRRISKPYPATLITKSSPVRNAPFRLQRIARRHKRVALTRRREENTITNTYILNKDALDYHVASEGLDVKEVNEFFVEGPTDVLIERLLDQVTHRGRDAFECEEDFLHETIRHYALGKAQPKAR